MKKFSKIILALTAIATLNFSCSSDDSVFTPPVDTPVTTPKLIVTETGTEDVRDLKLTTDKDEVAVLVKFATETNSMRRLYITENTNGLGEEPYIFSNPDVDAKRDGSVDLKSDTKKELEYLIKFPTPLDNSTVVYKLWVTTSRGDFRNEAKNNSFITKTQETAVVGTITITRGAGGTPGGADVRELKDIIVLAAPLASGDSKTFVSLFNGETYKISTGEETAALWDFGYYYGETGKASLASTYDYPTGVIDVPAKSGVDKNNLNKIYFKLSSLDYAAVKLDSDLAAIAKPAAQRINQLKVNDVVEFVDDYGNKGVIKVTELNTGAGTSGFMKIDVKVMN